MSSVPTTLRRKGFVFTVYTYRTTPKAAEKVRDKIRKGGDLAETRTYPLGDRTISVVYATEHFRQ